MPLIEELPVTQSHRATHGWAYVPDVGPAPIAAIQPGSRKRGRDHTTAATANATAKQQKAVQARLDALDKENYKDGVSVAIPARAGAEKKRDKRTNTNARRILTYQRTFAHYLADEEANAAAAVGPAVLPTTASSKVDARRKASTTANASTDAEAAAASEPATPAPTKPPARRGRPPSAAKQRERERLKEQEKMPPPSTSTVKQEGSKDTDTTMTDAPTPSTSNPPAQSTSTSTSTPAPPATPAAAPPQPKPLYDPKLDSHPLLRTTGLPKMPTSRVMSLLLSEPPLSYAAARAKLPDIVTDDDGNGNSNSKSVEKPVRRFCGICGYWGKVKCRKCGEWTCGLMECWRGHEGVCVAQGMF